MPDFQDTFKQIISKNSYQKEMEKDRKNRSKREIRGRK